MEFKKLSIVFEDVTIFGIELGNGTYLELVHGEKTIRCKEASGTTQEDTFWEAVRNMGVPNQIFVKLP